MNRILKKMMLIVMAAFFAVPAVAQNKERQLTTQQTRPPWVQRGIPGPGHAALAPLVSRDIRTTRVWIADGQYIEDTTEGTVEGQPYWRRGWLGYSNLDRRYEWVTVAPRVPMMIYLGKPGSGDRMPIEVTGVFTDQGVVSEQTVGKPVGQRTVISIESNDRHVFELYFTPPEGKEQLALRMVYTRIR